MSYLLESLGRGLLPHLLAAFENQLPGNETERFDELEQRRDSSPTSADLAMRLGMAYLRELRLGEARAALDTAMELSTSSLQPALGLACVYDELGKLPESLRYLSIAQANDPKDPAIVFGLAFCYERMGEMDAALANYKRAITLCPQLRNAHERAAAIAVKRGDWSQAISCYEQLAQLEPDDLDVLLVLANLFLQAQRPREAIERFQRALLIEPECSDGPLDTSLDLAADGKLTEAIRTLENLTQKYPGVADFHIRLGDLYVKAGEDTRAVEQFRAAVDAQPNYLEATVKLGTQHMRRGRFVDAAQLFNRAVELNDRLMTAFVGLGVAQRAAGREREAAATFDLAASLEPNSTLLFSETARLQLEGEYGREPKRFLTPSRTPEPQAENGDFLSEALRRHRQALLQNPDHADLHYRYGLLLRQMGEFEGAIDAFQSAIAINPQYVKALIKLGVCLKEAGRADEAIEIFQRALTLRGEYVDVHYELGLLFAQRNRFDLALEEFERAVTGQQHNASFRANLALALQNVGMVDKASATWRAICDLSHDDDSILTGQRSVARNPR